MPPPNDLAASIGEQLMLPPEEHDLEEFRNAILNGTIVGIGSLVLQFSTAAQIIQCPFQVDEGKNVLKGHGEIVDSSSLLFVFLNLQVIEIKMDEDCILSMRFENDRWLHIIPERNGLESYVISSTHDIVPVLVG
jgi:hypothetical protein